MLLNFATKKEYTCEDLVMIMSILRSEGGCPWDLEQTHLSIRKNFLEEVYEALEAIDQEDSTMLCEELGDVLLQVVFHARISQELNEFNFNNVADGICKKLIHRHPHIFSNTIADTSSKVLENWDKIKKEEKGQKTCTDTLKSVPKVLPALMRSDKVQSRAAKSGFDYPNTQWAFKDLLSEVEELKSAIVNSDRDNMEEELGDLLFSIVNVSRFLELDAEKALTRSCEKFIYRFEKVEELSILHNVDMKTSSMDQLDQLWKEAKKK